MTNHTLQDILPLVEKPSRYLGTEINTVKKDHGKVLLRMALAFPDLYEIGTSHFGLQILYSILNRNPDIAAERVFAPGTDMETRLRTFDIPLMSLETYTPIDRFDVVGFSLLYELNYTNILTILDLSRIPYFWHERNDTHPLIIAGGPCTCNPEPVAELFDAMVVGDGEVSIRQMTDTWIQWKETGDGRRTTLLKMWSEIEGVYVPAFFNSENNASGHQIVTPVHEGRGKVTRAVINDLDASFFPDSPIIPFGKPVHDRLRLEVARGCTRGCRFCQAGMIYRPVRERSTGTLLTQTDSSLGRTGYGNLSLLSLSTGDYASIGPLMEQLMDHCDSQRIAVSLPSIRAGTLTPKLMSHIKRVRKTGFTIAPEAGSQRLRDVINKNITESDIYRTVENAFGLGWQVIKLYFMIGLPTETDQDLNEMIDLVKRLRKIKGPDGRKGKINVSVSTFIPKPHTPFQWSPQMSLEKSREKIRWIRERLRMPGIQVKWQNPEMSILEGLWSRGDRRLSRLLTAAHEKGCRFDGWSDQFRFESWMEAVSECGIDMDFFTTRQREITEPLPWDHMDMKLSKEFLAKEWERAVKGEPTKDCRNGQCHTCGVCDFSTLKPVVFSEDISEISADGTPGGPGFSKRAPVSASGVFKVKVSYEKRDTARYFGHLELRNIMLRAIRRAAIPVSYSQGYHPMPKVAFDDPLPVGIESLNESLIATLDAPMKPAEMMKRLNDELPEGLGITQCQLWSGKGAGNPQASKEYEIALTRGALDETRLEKFKQEKEWIVHRTNRKGRTTDIDLKQMVVHMESTSTDHLKMVLKAEPGKTPRPTEILTSVFNLSEVEVKQARILKRAG